MKFTTKDELIEQAIFDGACDKGIEFAKSCKDLQEIFARIDSKMLLWCLDMGYEQFAEHCDLSVLDNLDLVAMLEVCPQYADYCDWSKFYGIDWAIILKYHPQYADHCDWSKLSDYNWDLLLPHQPQFEVYRQNSNGV